MKSKVLFTKDVLFHLSCCSIVIRKIEKYVVLIWTVPAYHIKISTSKVRIIMKKHNIKEKWYNQKTKTKTKRQQKNKNKNKTKQKKRRKKTKQNKKP